MFTIQFLNFLLFIVLFLLAHKWYTLEKHDQLKNKKNNLYLFNRNRYENKRFRGFSKILKYINK